MPTPSTIARTKPSFSGMLCDGHSTTIAFEEKQAIVFAEVTVGLPGLDGGEPIENDDMFSTKWRKICFPSLVTATPYDVTAKYDPASFNDLVSMLNSNQNISIHLPNGGSIDHYGAITSVTYDPLETNVRPMMTITVTPSNEDPDDNSEQAPVYTPGSGT